MTQSSSAEPLYPHSRNDTFKATHGHTSLRSHPVMATAHFVYSGPSPHLCQVLCTTEHGPVPKDILCSSEHVIYDCVAIMHSWDVVCPELTRS